MGNRTTWKRRLEAAGYRYVSGWLPRDLAEQVRGLIRDHRNRVERIKAEEPPRGNPKWRKGE